MLERCEGTYAQLLCSCRRCCWCRMGGSNKKPKKNCATSSTTDGASVVTPCRCFCTKCNYVGHCGKTEKRDVMPLRGNADHCWRTVLYGKSGRFRKILKTAIQSEIENISTETLTKVLKSFVLRSHKVHDLRGHHMEHILA
jgi:hypothetical protein